MRVIIIALATMLALVPMVRADEDKTDPPRKGTIRAEDLPKPNSGTLAEDSAAEQKD